MDPTGEIIRIVTKDYLKTIYPHKEVQPGLLTGVRKEYDTLKPKYDLVRTLIERRNQLQISQTRLAKIIGTRQPAISRLEKGDSNTTLSTLLKVAEALDLDIALSVRSRTK